MFPIKAENIDIHVHCVLYDEQGLRKKLLNAQFEIESGFVIHRN
jgi:hypothetical protein